MRVKTILIDTVDLGDVVECVEEELNRWLSSDKTIKVDRIHSHGNILMIFYEGGPKVYENFQKRPLSEDDKKLDKKCPRCSSPMMIRTKKADGSMFLGCSTFPECKGTLPMTEEDKDNIWGKSTENKRKTEKSAYDDPDHDIPF